MRNIKGPKSALSDYIQQSNIRIKNIEKCENIVESPRISKPKASKRVKYSKPFELVNSETIKILEEDKLIENTLQNIDKIEITDELLNTISMYLSRKRKMSKQFFDFLVDKCRDKLVIYDCSMIKDSEFVISKNLRRLELFQCGQLTESTLNFILSQMKDLEILKITGAFLIENFNVPSKLKILDVSNCSRLKNSFINNINSSLKELEELKLSFCYGFTSEAELFVNVRSLYICETKLSEKFYNNIKTIRKLSIKRCPNINSLLDISELEYLDIEGIVTVNHIPSSTKLLSLNITDCVQIEDLDFINLKYLKAANISLNENKIEQIFKMKNLKELDISWNVFVGDNILEKLLNMPTLQKISVFGCFGLTKMSVDLAYRNRHKFKIIGNPSETKYLLEEL